MQSNSGVTFQIDFDFVDHRLVVRAARGTKESFEANSSQRSSRDGSN
jgi:hypothetical protein